MADLLKYRPGQIITSMTKRVFMELWEDMQSGEALKRWPKGKVAETRREHTEEARIKTIGMIIGEHGDVFQWLLDEDWGVMEVYVGENGMLHFRVMESGTVRLAKAKALHRQYYGR